MKTALVILISTFAFTACGGQNFDVSSDEDRQAAQIEWDSMEQGAQDIVCDMFNEDNDVIDKLFNVGELSRSEIEARMNVMQDNC